MPYVIDIILSSGSLSIRRFCGGRGGWGGEEKTRALLTLFSLIMEGYSGLSLDGSYVSHISIIVTTTAWLSDHDKLNKGEQSSDLKK